MSKNKKNDDYDDDDDDYEYDDDDNNEEEDDDDDYNQQLERAILVFAHYIGINIEKEESLLSIARDALTKLPNGWELAFGDGDNAGIVSSSSYLFIFSILLSLSYFYKGIPYFFNENTEESVWNHPKEEYYMQKVKDERIKLKEKEMKKNEKEKSDVIELKDFDNFDDTNFGNKKKSTTINNSNDNNQTKAKTETRGFGLNESDFIDNKPTKTTTTITGHTKEIKAIPFQTNDKVNNSKAKKDDDLSMTIPAARGSGWTSSNIDKSSISQNDSSQKWNNNSSTNTKEKKEIERIGNNSASIINNNNNNSSSNNNNNNNNDKKGRPDNYDSRDSRERERSRDRDIDYSNRRSSDNELKSLHTEYLYDSKNNKGLRELEDKYRELQRRSNSEIDYLNDSLKENESKLADERENKRNLEEKINRMQKEMDSRVRGEEDAAEDRLRDAVRREEDKWKDKVKSIERRYNDDLEEIRAELAAAKRKNDDLQREIESARKKIILSREDGKLEALAEFEASKRSLSEEVQNKTQSTELKKLREDYAILAGKMASALQMAQVSAAEAEAAKAQASSAVAEGQTSHSALIQATQRMQHLDNECSQLRAEISLVRRENESQLAELRKLQVVGTNAGDRASNAEADVRRAKNQAQQETSRLTSRIAELEAINNVQRSQLDKASEMEAFAVRDVQRLLDRSEFDNSRLKERVMELEKKSETDISRIVSLEREIANMQEQMFRKDRFVKEEKQRAEIASSRIEEIRAGLENEIEEAHRKLHEEKIASAESSRKHKQEIEQLKKEVIEKIPQITTSTVERLEAQWTHRLESEANNIRLRYEQQMDRMRREIAELQSLQAEREARQRALYADERAELERLRYQNQRLQRRSEELESELDDMKRENRRSIRANPKEPPFKSPYDTNIFDDNNVNPLRPETNLDDTNNQTMTLLQGQLNFMKQQLHLSLDNTKFRESLNQKLYSSLPLPNESTRNNHNSSRFDKESSRVSYREELDIDNDDEDRKEDAGVSDYQSIPLTAKKNTKKNDKRFSPESLMETPYVRNQFNIDRSATKNKSLNVSGK